MRAAEGQTQAGSRAPGLGHGTRFHGHRRLRLSSRGLALLRALAARGLPHQGKRYRKTKVERRRLSRRGQEGGRSLCPKHRDVQRTVHVSTG